MLRYKQLAARMIWTKYLGKPSIMVGWWFCKVWTGWSTIVSKHPIHQVAFFLFILFFKIILVENIYCGKELNQFRPLKSNDDLCLFFFLYALIQALGGYWVRYQLDATQSSLCFKCQPGAVLRVIKGKVSPDKLMVLVTVIDSKGYHLVLDVRFV